MFDCLHGENRLQYKTTFLMSACSLKRERSNLFCNSNGLCEARKTSGTRGLIHMQRHVKDGRKPEGCLQLHSCLEISLLQHKRFVFIVVDTNREDTLKINQDAQIKRSISKLILRTKLNPEA